MPLPRFHIEGHVYYITTVVYNRLRIFARPSFVMPLLDSLNFYRHSYEFKLLGYVIMPDHVHFIIWPSAKKAVEAFLRSFKEFTAKRIIQLAEVEKTPNWVNAFRQAGAETRRSKNKVWQDSYWDENVFTGDFLKQKLQYMHNNPVRAGLVSQPEDYPYSSYRNYENDQEWLIQIDKDWAQ